jgi:hypothetical protein
LEDLKVGAVCVDRDGNSVRIDHINPEQGSVTYHFLNEELDVQEGVREFPLAKFLAENWRTT